MALIEANWNPTNRQLQQFGVVGAIVVPVAGWMWGASPNAIAVMAGVGFLFACLAAAAPRLIAPIFVGLMLISLPIGVVVGEIVLVLVYGLVFVPIGIGFRLVNRDRLKLRFSTKSKSYWTPKAQAKSVAKYYHQS
ncbi:MAG: hypothetical protein SGI77_24590 [Pirellulaceae bacterium]|nr:hypothetical protein [Pirellulaceae bacterium]